MSGINGINNQNYGAYTQAAQTEAQGAAQQSAENEAAIIDEVEIGSTETEKTNNSDNKIYSQNTSMVNYLKQVQQQNMQQLHSMVQKLLGNQNQVGSSLTSLNESFFSFNFDLSFAEGNDAFNFNFNFESYSFSAQQISSSDGMVQIDQATRDQASAMIGEDGIFGVKQVSQNILDFAKALSGGDVSKLETLKNAFLKGFNEVANMFGGKDKMPEVSQKTYDAVMDGFDAWANDEE